MRHQRCWSAAALFCLLLTGVPPAWAQQGPEAAGSGAAADVVFLVDPAWSVGKEHFRLVREFLCDVVRALAAGPQDFHFALVQFDGNPQTEFLLNTYRSPQEVLSHLSNLSYVGGRGPAPDGVESAVQADLLRAAGSRAADGVPQLILALGGSQGLPSAGLLSADAGKGTLAGLALSPLRMHMSHLENLMAFPGPVGNSVSWVRAVVALREAPRDLVLLAPSGGRSLDDVSRLAQRLRRAGIMAFAVGSKVADEAELREVAFNASLVFVPAEFRTAPLHALLPGLLAPLRTLSGTMEGEGVGGKRDVVFLIDDSQATVPEFQHIRILLERLVGFLDVGLNTTRVSVVQFSEDPRVEFLLNTHSSKEEVLGALKTLRPKGGRQVHLGGALEYVTRNIFRRPLGSRIEEGVPQFLVLIYSGGSSDEVDEPAAELKRAGVAPLTVARNADREELLKISLSPEYVFSLSTFRELPSLEQKLLTPITTLMAQQIQQLLDASTYPPPDVPGDAADIVFLIDSSDGVKPEGLAHIRDFVGKIVRKLSIGPSRVRVGVVQFSNEVHPEFYLKTHKAQGPMLEAIRRLRFKGGAPLNTGKALEFVARNLFVKSAGSRIEDGVPQHLVLFLGGRSQDDVSRFSQVIRNSGIMSLGIGDRNSDRTEMQVITSHPGHVVTVREFKELPRVEDRVMDSFGAPRVTPAPPDVDMPSPSRPGVGGKRDVVFLIDGSQAADPEFQHIRNLLERLVGFLDVGLDTTRVSVVQFSEDPWVEFLLNTHSSKEEVLGAVKALRPKGGRQVHLGTALKYVTRNIFRRLLGSRIEEGVPQFLVLISSGRSSDEVDEPAAELKRVGVAPLTVARNADREELLKISLSPEYMFSLSTFRELPSLEQKLLTSITMLTAQQIQQLLDASTYPPPGVGGKRDVVFLIDDSQATVPEFQHIHILLERLVGFLDVGLNTTRVSVVQFSEDPRVEFLLNTHSSKEEVLGAVKALRPKGGRQVHLGGALEYVTRNIFRRLLGSRIEEGVPQFLVLIYSGGSSDEVDEPAAELKRAGVAPLTVARNADREELLKISLSPEYVFSLSTFRELPSLEQKLLTPITTLTAQQIQQLLDASTYPPPGVGSKRDVVFLIDSSQATGPEFQHVRTFLERLVGFLDVGLDTTRVSVVQFSEYLRVEFLLNTHSSKEEVLGAVKALRPKGGQQVHLGTALKYVTRNTFRRPLGSRIEEGVPQFLVLISSGRSSDEVDEPAAELKRAGVAPLTVARNADREELLKISLSPEYVFSLSTFRELPSLEQKLLTPITTLTAQQIQQLLDASPYPPPGETGRAAGGAAPSVTSPESKVL